jgi:TRAP-type C4-dicarboxylate transport system permease small subunit
MDTESVRAEQRVDVDRSSNVVSDFIQKQRKLLVVMFMLVMMLVLNGFSFAQSSIAFDPTTLIDQINVWVPVFLPILGIGLGITIAIALIEKVGGSILKAFRS